MRRFDRYCKTGSWNSYFKSWSCCRRSWWRWSRTCWIDCSWSSRSFLTPQTGTGRKVSWSCPSSSPSHWSSGWTCSCWTSGFPVSHPDQPGTVKNNFFGRMEFYFLHTLDYRSTFSYVIWTSIKPAHFTSDGLAEGEHGGLSLLLAQLVPWGLRHVLGLCGFVSGRPDRAAVSWGQWSVFICPSRSQFAWKDIHKISWTSR